MCHFYGSHTTCTREEKIGWEKNEEIGGWEKNEVKMCKQRGYFKANCTLNLNTSSEFSYLHYVKIHKIDNVELLVRNLVYCQVFRSQLQTLSFGWAVITRHKAIILKQILWAFNLRQHCVSFIRNFFFCMIVLFFSDYLGDISLDFFTAYDNN